MVEKLRYVCEKCGAEYVEQENAIACEARHVPINSVEVVKYPQLHPTNLQTTNYPKIIKVEMEDGKVMQYLLMKGEC